MQPCDYKRDRLWVRFLLEEMKYFIFSFLRSSVEVKRGVEFHHSTRNAAKVFFVCLFLHGVPYLATCGIQREAEKHEYLIVLSKSRFK